MKRKNVPEGIDESVVNQAILEQAKQALRSDQLKPLPRCVICNSESAPNSTEQLCWVCRRLKISAWRDSEQQMGAQE